MKSCALVGRVDFNVEHFKAQSFDCVVAVDSGYAHLMDIGCVPDQVIGDFDSLGYVPDHPHVERHPTRKDAGDMELAMHWAYTHGYEQLVLYGCLGGRLDFTYAITQNIAHYTAKGCRVFAVGPDTVLTALEGSGCNEIAFSEGAEGLVSVFAATDTAAGVTEVGLEYLLDNVTLTSTEPLGVSNEFTGRASRISVTEGRLLVFFPVQAWPYRIVQAS